MSDSVREKGGKPENKKKSFGRPLSFPQRLPYKQPFPDGTSPNKKRYVLWAFQSRSSIIISSAKIQRYVKCWHQQRSWRKKDEEERWKQKRVIKPEPFIWLCQVMQNPMKLCKSKTFDKVFVNVTFKIAFASSENIRQMIVRTKLW